MQDDLRERLNQAQQRLANAARELDGASVHIRTLLSQIEKEKKETGGNTDES